MPEKPRDYANIFNEMNAGTYVDFETGRSIYSKQDKLFSGSWDGKVSYESGLKMKAKDRPNFKFRFYNQNPK